MINILPNIRQENKDSSPLSFGSRQYLAMQSNHTVQVALKNVKTQKRLLRAWMKLAMEAPEVSQGLVGTATDCTLCFIYRK